MPKVILAGHNVDIEVLDAIRKGEGVGDAVTPETISAAYARISRDPRPVTELRRAARAEVERARASNSRIVFDMGHHSIAEHAVFNFDILEVSRLAIEAIESHRLASFTEKSQRYIRLGEDYVLPAEVASSGLERDFRAFLERSFERYARVCDALVALGIDQRHAGEDARYVLPLATSGQLGMTVNARTLERMILRFSASPINEVRELGQELLRQTKPIAPSLLLFYEPGPYEKQRFSDIAETVSSLGFLRQKEPDCAVTLVNATEDGDARVLAALAQPALRTSYSQCLDFVKKLSDVDRTRIFEATTRYLGVHDPLPRELEHVFLTFDVTISAAAYAQLKRHRMSTQSPMPYDPDLGITIPPAFERVGLVDILKEAHEEAMRLWEALGGPNAPASAYALLNAHRRRVLVSLNLRELYHISRLREDSHAQWDIRAIVREMSRLARNAFPISASLLGGKDEFIRQKT